MENLRDILQDNLNIEFLSATLSNPRSKGGVSKVKVRPLMKKDTLFFQLESFQNNQAFHKNLGPEETCEEILGLMEEFRQMQMETKKSLYTVLVSKKGKITIKKKAQSGCVKEVDLSHNRKKSYLLEEGMQVPFLQDLGVMTKEGKIVRSRFDKFRQINRFLEFIEDILPELPSDRELTILDFGCGKSYLTFAMYYYLHELQGRDIEVTGLDLKTDVIKYCNELAEKLGYDRLKFERGDISTYEGATEVDMVVSLHACDKATDYALEKAVKWGAKVILAVPCCQHELNSQIRSEVLQPVKYGLIKERMAALITDALRANLLEQQGYDTQILEFIDLEHTPKNLLIRAVKKTGNVIKSKGATSDISRVEELLHIEPTLEQLLNEENTD